MFLKSINPVTNILESVWETTSMVLESNKPNKKSMKDYGKMDGNQEKEKLL